MTAAEPSQAALADEDVTPSTLAKEGADRLEHHEVADQLRAAGRTRQGHSWDLHVRWSASVPFALPLVGAEHHHPKCER